MAHQDTTIRETQVSALLPGSESCTDVEPDNGGVKPPGDVPMRMRARPAFAGVVLLLASATFFTFDTTVQLQLLACACAESAVPDPDCNLPSTSAVASQWLMYTRLAQGIGALISAGSLGSAADRFGRRPVMSLNLLGMVAMSGASLAVETVRIGWRWPLVGSAAINGAVGAVPLLLLCLYAYVADSTNAKERALVFTILEGLTGVGGMAGTYFAGAVTQKLGLATSFGVVFGVACTNALGVLVFLPAMTI